MRDACGDEVQPVIVRKKLLAYMCADDDPFSKRTHRYHAVKVLSTLAAWY